MGLLFKNNTIITTGLQMSDLKTIYDTLNETKFLDEFDISDVMYLCRSYSNVNCFVELLAVYNLYTYTHNKSVTRESINIAYRGYQLILNGQCGVRARSICKSNTINEMIINFLVIKRMDYIYNQLTGSRILHVL